MNLALLNSHKKQDGHDYAFNMDIGLRKWRLAKARIDNGENTEIFNVNFIGDSIGEGLNGLTTTLANYLKCYAGYMRTYFNTKYGDVGQGWIGNRYPTGNSAPNRRWIYTGASWVNFGVNGWMNTSNAMARATTQNDYCELTFSGTGITVFLEAFSGGGTITFTIDGGAGETLNVSGTDGTIKTYTKTGLADTAHTIRATLTSASGRLSPMGAYEIKGTKGIRLNQLCTAGAKVDGPTHSEIHLQCCVDMFQPKLSIIDFCANDFNTQTDLATYRTQFQTLITRALVYGDVIITTIGGIYQQTSQTIPIQSYRDVAYSLAIANNCVFVDLAKRMGDTYAVASSLGYLADAVHPKPEGHQDISTFLLDVVLS